MSLKRFPAELEYKRNPKLSKETVIRLLEWTKNEPHLPEIDEEDVILFFSSCKFDENYTKKTLDYFYTFRTLHPEYFGTRHLYSEKYLSEHQVGIYHVMPGYAPDGSKVLYCGILSSADITKYDMIKETAIFMAHHELILHEEGAVSGWRMVYDMQNSTMGMIFRMRLSILVHIIDFFQNACPVHLVGVHVVNPKPYVTYLSNATRPFVHKSKQGLLHIHSKAEDIFKFIPKKNLPSNCGGDLPAAKDFERIARSKLADNLDILMKNQNQTVNEAFRPKKHEGSDRIWKSIWGP